MSNQSNITLGNHEFIWINETEANISDGTISILANEKTDFFNSPVQENGMFPKPLANATILYTELTGDFVFRVKVKPTFEIFADAAAIMIYELEFLISSDLETFISVEVDGLVLAEDLYELSSGSTVISLTPEYLSTLEEGTYEIVFNTEIGSVGTTFEIVGETDSTTVAPTDETDPTTVGPTDETDPTTTSEGAGGTGEGSRGMILAISLIGVAVILIIILYLRRRRENES